MSIHKTEMREHIKHFVDTISNWAVVLTGLVIERIVIAVAFIIIARGSSLEQYGQLVSCLALGNLLLVLPNYGIDEWFLTQSKNSPETNASLFNRSMWFRRQLLILWIIGMSGLAFILPRTTYPSLLLFIIILGLSFDSLTSLIFSSLRVARKHLHITYTQLASSVLLIGFVLLLPSEHNRVLIFTIGRTMLSFGTFCAAYAVSKIDLNLKNAAKAPLSPNFFFSAASAFFKTDIASTIYINADKTIIPMILGSIAAGIYGPATNLLQVTFLIPRALYYFIVPDLTRTFHFARSTYRQKVFFELTAMASTGILISIFMYIFAPWMIKITFGQEYAESTNVLMALSPIAFIRCVNFGLAAVLISSNLQNKRNRIQWISAGFNVLANLTIIVPYGVVGVAWVYVLSEVILMIGYLWITVQNGLFCPVKEYQVVS